LWQAVLAVIIIEMDIIIHTTKVVKIVLIGKFCTNLRSPKSSHTTSMLRFLRLASHKIFSIIDDFSVWQSSDWQISHKPADSEKLTYDEYAALSSPCFAQNFLNH